MSKWNGLVAAVALAVVACGDGDSPPADAGRDAPADARREAMADAPPEAAQDAPPEAAQDAPPEASPPDGGDGGAVTYDFSCTSIPVPDTAPDPLTVEGTVVAVAGDPIAGAQVRFYRGLPAMGATMVASGTTDASGSFSLEVGTGGMAHPGFLQADAAMHVPTRFMPSLPWFTSFEPLGVGVLPQGLWDVFIRGMLGQTDGNGFLGIGVLDCAGALVEGAEVSVEGADGSYTVVYLVPGLTGPRPDPTATSTSRLGQALVVNVDPTSPATITVSHPEGSWAPFQVTAEANLATFVLLLPMGADVGGGGGR